MSDTQAAPAAAPAAPAMAPGRLEPQGTVRHSLCEGQAQQAVRTRSPLRTGEEPRLEATPLPQSSPLAPPPPGHVGSSRGAVGGAGRWEARGWGRAEASAARAVSASAPGYRQRVDTGQSEGAAGAFAGPLFIRQPRPGGEREREHDSCRPRGRSCRPGVGASEVLRGWGPFGLSPATASACPARPSPRRPHSPLTPARGGCMQPLPASLLHPSVR